MALTDAVMILLGVSGFLVAGLLFVFRGGIAVDELAAEYDEVRRLLRRLPAGWLVWAFRAFGIFLVLLGLSFGYVVLRPTAPISAVLSTVLTVGVLLFVGTGGVVMVLRPRAIVPNAIATPEVIYRRLPDVWADRVIRAFGVLCLLSVLFFLYILFVY